MCRYPPEIREFILQNYKGVGHAEMAKRLKEQFGAEYSKEQIKRFYGNHKLNSGLTGRFGKGHTPANKGVRGIHFSEATEFKKGNRPHNWLPVGTELVKSDGYIWRKVAEPNKWRQKHVLVWEEANGPKPKGTVIIFADGNRYNTSLDNLLCITKAQNAIINKHKLRGGDAELTKAGIIVADIQMAISKLQKKKST